ncbi:neurogenic locus notch homolog protein 1-like [Saccostrea cucullata]|uniref:neurogenic locus notch homolog protein 1-like n=1 Tax=Saccostrea cuccullata TaxID=36930 RepID=UPI002ED1D1A3
MKLRVVSILLYICTICIKSSRSQICTLDMECHLFNWLPWNPCTGTCGSQSQFTDRRMCCSLVPATLETCLTSCNRSIHFPMHRTQSCQICENGGTVEPSSLSCRCGPHYKGGCCQDLVTCQDNPCKHGICTDEGITFTCTCDKGYTGTVCDTLETLELPESVRYVEYGLLSLVSVIGVMATGCVCLKCCQTFGINKKGGTDDDDDENEEEKWKKNRKNLIFPQKHSKSKAVLMDF